MDSTDSQDDNDLTERGHPPLPAGIADGVLRLAGESSVHTDTVLLAAKLKVAAVVTGAPSLHAREDTWRDLISRVATEAGRQEAAAAWHSVRKQRYVPLEQVAGLLLIALGRLTSAPDEPHHRCILLTPAECEALVQASSGPVRQLPDRRFHELFEERARRHPNTIAAVQGDRSWSYREVNRCANKIAWSLHRRGLRCEDVVAVVTERTLEWLAAVLAIFKAGGCYLPLEPHFPAARLTAALSRSECTWVLAARDAAHLDEAIADRDSVELSYLDELLAQDGPEDDLGLPVAADQLAYLYFTSGSTGEPKGAMCEHDGFLNHLLAKIEDFGIEEGGVVAQTAPLCFDISLWQLVCPLLVGGRTHIIEQDVILDVRSFVAMLASGGVQIAQLVPSYLDVVLSALQEQPTELPELRCLAVTGEALKKELVHRWFNVFPAVPLVNCYGTTEVSDDTNHEVMHVVPAHRSVPLGNPIRNVRVYVMDDRLNLVPPGAPGEIMFAGVCVGRGYVNDAARTKAAFMPDPYRPGERLYRSGDFGRWLPTGELEYLGRRDSQVKVSGFRIEIGEIENRLLQIPGVRDSAVVIAGSAGEPQLAGYYTGLAASGPEQVGKALAALLPGYMVPQRLYHMRELPLSANGKIDKMALSRQAAAEVGRVPEGGGFEALVTGTERRVATLWSELLKIPAQQIGRGSHFAELGGTSLSAIRLAIALDRLVTVGEMRDTPTVADVAALLDRKTAERYADVSEPSVPESPRS
jgi:amino acid adenylation domain-containing protein